MHKQYIAQTTVLVNDYDEAIDFYVGVLGFNLLEDTTLTDSSITDTDKRWVLVSPPLSESRLLLAKAATAEQRARVGDQTGGRVFLFLNTNDFWRDYHAFKSKGVEFVRGEPREEAYGTVAVFLDVYGNLWDLIQPTEFLK